MDTFLIILIIAVIVLGNLRLFMLIASAFVLALVVVGAEAISEAATGGGPSTRIQAPAQPGPELDDPGGQSDNSLQAQPEHPR